MRRKAVIYTIISQGIFIITVAVCTVLRPQVLLGNNAFSFFGSYMPTAVPFTAGLLAMAATLIAAARTLPKSDKTNQWLSCLFAIIALHITTLALVPYAVNHIFYAVHITAAYSLGLVFLVAGGWLIAKAKKDTANFSLYGLLVTGMVLGALSTSEIGKLHFIALGQLIVIFSFSGLLIRTVKQIEHVEFAGSKTVAKQF